MSQSNEELERLVEQGIATMKDREMGVARAALTELMARLRRANEALLNSCLPRCSHGGCGSKDDDVWERGYDAALNEKESGQ